MVFQGVVKLVQTNPIVAESTSALVNSKPNTSIIKSTTRIDVTNVSVICCESGKILRNRVRNDIGDGGETE
jgi:hypothetical protein